MQGSLRFASYATLPVIVADVKSFFAHSKGVWDAQRENGFKMGLLPCD